MLNLNKVGRPLARIDGGKYSGRVVSVSDQFSNPNGKDADSDDLINEFRQLKIANDSKFQHVPDTTKEREILYITGPSGSGKSTYTRKYLEQYKKKFKSRPIYLFSSLPSDESLDKVGPKRIKLDETLHTDPIKVKELSESICIFDDIDVISEKKVREAVYDILNQVLEIGRHYKIHCVVTNHLPTNGKDTRRILNEAHTVTYFPHSSAGKIRYLLEEYVGLDKKQISYMKKQNSRWCSIYKNYPQCYVLEHEIGLLNIHDDSSEDDDRLMAPRTKNKSKKHDQVDSEQVRVV
jgi:energy-coupling factor transporter ATP-binding protein EcfA2